MADSQTLNRALSSNDSFSNPSVIQIRIDTKEIIQQLKDYLMGYELVEIKDNNTGRVNITKKAVYTPLCNDQGVRMIVGLVNQYVNPASVQGYWTRDKYENECYLLHIELTYCLAYNYDSWNIEPDSLEMIIITIMGLIRPFLSRLIDNKERDSYVNTVRVNENSEVRTQSDVFSLFGRK